MKTFSQFITEAEKQSVIFLDVESAFFWKNVVQLQGCKQVEVLPVF